MTGPTHHPSFGDEEAEDAWDASDSRADHIANLLLRLAQFEGHNHVDHLRGAGESDEDLLDRIEQRLQTWLLRRDEVDAHLRLRIDLLAEDLQTTRGQT